MTHFFPFKLDQQNIKWCFVKPIWTTVVVEDVDALLCSRNKIGVRYKNHIIQQFTIQLLNYPLNNL